MQEPTARPSAANLLATKFFIPPLGEGWVPRPRLLEHLASGLACRLTLVSAPAGFGKSSILAQWVRHAPPRNARRPAITWLSLDGADNDPARFLSYVIAALQKVVPGVAGDLVAALRSPHPPSPETIITALVNELAAAPDSLILVLDDYHTITSPAVNGALTFLLENLPPNLHLVISTRSDPPIPVARLRSQCQVAEIRTDDLRFTPGEAAAFLSQTMGLTLSSEQVAALDKRAEGWIAGLQMAALSMRGREDVDGFIRAFAGTNRFIMDYLLEEVLAREPEEVQAFLLQTAILARLSGPLCDAVTGASGGQEVLEGLERRNLFVVPLDDDRRWYRYHHLFADLLCARLGQLYPDLVPCLHARAAAWLERQGMTVEAVNHALAAGEYDHAAGLVEENTTRLLAQGELNALMGWIEMLPAKHRLARPWLCVHQAYALAFAGQLDKVPPLLAQAETTLRATAAQSATDMAGEEDEIHVPSARGADLPSPADSRSLAGAIAAIRAMAAVMTGRDAEAISPARRARELLPAGNLWDRASAAWALGYALHSQGHLVEAHAAFEEMVQLGQAMGNIWTLVSGLTDLSRVLQAQGKMRQARARLEEALAEASQKGARSLGFIARSEANLAGVLYEQNELAVAQHLLTDAIAHARFWPNPNHLAVTYALLARVQLALGDLQRVRTSIDEAGRIDRSAALTRFNRRMVEAALVRVWLALQASGIELLDGPLAEEAGAFMSKWRNELAGSTEGTDEIGETEVLDLARVALATGRSEEALSWLEPLTASARAAGHTNVQIGSLALIAIAREAGPAPRGVPASQAAPALTELEEALALAERGGYVRVFVDEGEPMADLLRKLAARRAPTSEGGSYSAQYLAMLLAAFGAPADGRPLPGPPQPAAAGRTDRKAQPLVEPLSERELQVLRLMAEGLTNQQIAATLIIALGTVKAHVHNIAGKLGAENRAHAVARAKELGLL